MITEIDVQEDEKAPLVLDAAVVRRAVLKAINAAAPDHRQVQEAMVREVCYWLYVPETAEFTVVIRKTKGGQLIVSCDSDSSSLHAQFEAIGVLAKERADVVE